MPRASGVGGATTGTTELVLRLCTLSASVASGFGSDDYDFGHAVQATRKRIPPQKKFDSYCSDLHSSTGDRGPTPRHVSHKKETTGRALSNAAMRSVVACLLLSLGAAAWEHSERTRWIGRWTQDELTAGQPVDAWLCFDAAAIFRRAKVPDLLRSLGWRLPRSGKASLIAGRAQRVDK